MVSPILLPTDRAILGQERGGSWPTSLSIRNQRGDIGARFPRCVKAIKAFPAKALFIQAKDDGTDTGFW